MNIMSWLIIASITGALEAILVKLYIKYKSYYILPFIILAAIITIYSYYKIFSTNNIGICYPISKILSVLIVILFGIFLFNEKMSNSNYLGILFSIVAMYLLLCK